MDTSRIDGSKEEKERGSEWFERNREGLIVIHANRASYILKVNISKARHMKSHCFLFKC